VRRPLNELLRGVEIVPPADIPLFVGQANARPTRDEYFEYELTFDEGLRELRDPLRTLSLEIREREGAVGDSLQQLNEGSRFASLLRDLDPDEHWLAFEVDSATVDEFRRARRMASERGFAVMWNPKEIDFPFTHALAGGSPADLLRSRSSQSKPER
jgi:sulfur carrier protein ThiS